MRVLFTTPRCEHTLFVEDTRYQAGPSPVCVAWTDPEAARLTVTGNDAAPQQLLLLTIVADTRAELVKQIVSSDLAQHLLDDIGKILRAKLANK